LWIEFKFFNTINVLLIILLLLLSSSHYFGLIYFPKSSDKMDEDEGTGSKCEGILYDPGGKKVATYAWGLGHASNNQTEAYALLHGLLLAKEVQRLDCYH
jgi:hypothetical protein